MTATLKSILAALLQPLVRGVSAHSDSGARHSGGTGRFDADRSGYHHLIVEDFTPESERGDW